MLPIATAAGQEDACAGVPIGFLNTLHVQAGTPFFALQEMGGWSSVQRYAEKLCRPLTAVPEVLGTNWSQSTK